MGAIKFSPHMGTINTLARPDAQVAKVRKAWWHFSPSIQREWNLH